MGALVNAAHRIKRSLGYSPESGTGLHWRITCCWEARWQFPVPADQSEQLGQSRRVVSDFYFRGSHRVKVDPWPTVLTQ
jgi:hypothetical protein